MKTPVGVFEGKGWLGADWLRGRLVVPLQAGECAWLSAELDRVFFVEAEGLA